MIDPTPLRRAQLRSLAEARIERRAFYDALTGLPNRSLFDRRVAAAIADAGPGLRGFALLYIDLDGFGKINKTLGHAAGDELLRRVAPRLVRSIPPTDTVCRAGGDEFLVLLAETASRRDACRAASKLVSSLARPILVAGRPLVVSVSVGISLFPEHGEQGAVLLARADEALSRAKRDGRASIRIFGDAEDFEASA